GMIHQVMFNLISNAVKYSSKKKKPLIEISSEKSGNEIIFSVKDNGVGFDMQYVDKLFGVFQRLHGMNEFDGTGVGLAIVQRIVSKHNGRVWAEGKVDKGACFRIALPA
ncbi:MAG TPA: ATP-binding protein, partial [Bacteroidia bacterium]|nr:ATP-binding protein [Bacteroidia bacterium]